MKCRTLTLIAVSALSLLFSRPAAAQISPLHAFGADADGKYPNGTLVLAADGFFYGTTAWGGASDMGTVFRMSPAGAVTIIHSFNGATGRVPLAGLIQAADGFLYGTTPVGGAFGAGTVFKIDATGLLTVLHSFKAGSNGAGQPVYFGMTDGGNPIAPLIQAADGYFYGTTAYGGFHSTDSFVDQFGYGTIFRMDSVGNVVVLHSFLPTVTGMYPNGGLLQASDGLFYGAAGGNVPNGLGGGTVFRMDAAGNVTLLRILAPSGSLTDPAGAMSSLMQASDGFIYGVTTGGGTFQGGTVFRLSLAGSFAVVHSFNETTEGRPRATLVQAPDGHLYGTAESGGTYGVGTVYRLLLNGSVTAVESFNPGITGGYTVAALTHGNDGFLYGASTSGGASGGGVAFRVDPSNLCSPANPAATLASLLQFVDGLALDAGIKASLRAKLAQAAATLSAGQATAAENILRAFVNEVNAQSGKKVPASVATELKLRVTLVLSPASCG